jgi:CelD/BcsL family acetyltransferase involved in cellulose biosynthesis
LSVIEFADLDLTDYNAPFLGPAAPRDAGAVRTLWRDLLSALRRVPGGADLVRFRKMPLDLGGQPNPFSLLDDAGPCAANGNLVTTGEDYDAWRYTLEKTVRKELERSWRVFTRDPAAAFDIVTGNSEVMRILSTTEVQQGTRMQSLGLNFILNNETCASFYRNLVSDSVGSGYAVTTALTVDDEVVATLLGVRTGARYVMIRISNAGEKWSNCSPGRLIIERTMAALHRDGVREFDFSIGNYAYKRRFGVARIPLADLSASLSWRGLPYALRDRAARELRRYPKIAATIKRALGKPPSREEN